jgi:FlaA1/EpsC-like NDP-sugar epimerase
LYNKNSDKANIKYYTLITVLKDFLAFATAYALALFVEYSVVKFDLGPRYLLGWIAILTTILSLFITKSYRVIWRYASTTEVLNVVLAHSLTGIVLLFINSITDFFAASFALIIIYSFFAFSLSVILRFYRPIFTSIYRKISDKQAQPLTNLIIYGAGFTGSALAKRLIHNPDEGYNPVAFLDDDPQKIKQTIAGLRVVGGKDSISDVMHKYHASTIAIAINNISREQLREIYIACMNAYATIKVVSKMSDATNTFNTDAISLKNINIEDLLHRPEHQLDLSLLISLIKDKVVMVTGGAGSIGSELARQALEYGCKSLVIYDHFENGMFELNEEFIRTYDTSRYTLVIGTVKDREKLRDTMEKHKPNVVFHAAAYKHVPLMESNIDEAIKNNVFGTKNVIEQSIESNVDKFILISTDKAVNPANIMGASKRIAELIVQSKSITDCKTVFSAVRFGNVLGSSGSVIPTFIKQINAGGPITVTHRNMKRYFMTIPEAVKLVMQAAALAMGGEVFVLDMGEPVFIYDLATDLIKLSGMIPGRDIKILITGLRPGEKLFEELRFNNEDVDKTTHSGIFICKLEDVDLQMLDLTLEKLKACITSSDINENEIEKLIFEIVPNTYRNV